MGFDGTTGVDGTGTGDFMPWAGDTFQLNLFGPFEDFYNSLFTAPTGGLDGSGVEIPTGTETLDAFQNLTAGSIVAFDPFVAGSPACPGLCDLPADETQLGLLQDVLAWDPNNTSLAGYVSDFAAKNNATQPEINDADSTVANRGRTTSARQNSRRSTRRSATSIPNCRRCTPTVGS